MAISGSIPLQIVDLPTEITTLILSNLTVKQLETARQVCSAWHSAANALIAKELFSLEVSAKIVEEEAPLFFTGEGDYSFAVATVTKKRFFKSKKICTYSPEKLLNPKILSLSLKQVPISGGELTSFAQAHPNLMKLVIEDCSKISYADLFTAFSKSFKNLRSVTIKGEGFFNPDLLDKLLGNNPYLRKLAIQDESGRNIKDKRAHHTIDAVRNKLTVLELDLPNKTIL